MTIETDSLAVHRIYIQPGAHGTESDSKFLRTMLARTVETTMLPPVDLDEDPHAAAERVRATTAIDLVAHVGMIGIGLGVPTAQAISDTARTVTRTALIGGWFDMSERVKMLRRQWACIAADDRLTAIHLAVGSVDARSIGRRAAIPNADDVDSILHYFAAHSPCPRQGRPRAVPTLVVGCEESAIVPAAESTRLADALPDGRYAPVRAGHAVLSERAVPVLRLIEDHFRAKPMLLGYRARQVTV